MGQKVIEYDHEMPQSCKYHNHRLHTSPWYREEETILVKTSGSLFLSKMIAKLERAPRITPHKIRTQHKTPHKMRATTSVKPF